MGSYVNDQSSGGDALRSDVHRFDLQEHLAAGIKAEAARRDISRRGLAKRIGESPSWLRRRLNGEVHLDTNDLQRAAEALEIPLQDLMLDSILRGIGEASARTARPSSGRHRKR